MAVRTAYVATEAVGDVLTKANFDKLPGGWIGYVPMTADHTGITTQVDITGLTVTVTVNTSRRIRIYAEMSMQSSSVDDLWETHIYEDGVDVALREWRPTPANVAETAIISTVRTPSAGSHTYKIRGGRGFGAAGTWVVNGTSKPAYILVEDIGPAS